MKLKKFLAIMAMGLCAVACSDDDNKGEDEDTFDPNVTTVTNGDYSDYASWVYVNLETGKMEKHADTSEWIYTDGTTVPAKADETIGIDWHIAIHRYEIKTNGGQVCNTGVEDISAVKELPAGATYTADAAFPFSDDAKIQVITDMTKMQQGSVGYSKNPMVNEALCGWVEKKATGSMPPTIYTPTKKVYVVKFADGSWAKLQFTEAGNTETNKSGFITWKYAFYPAAQK